MVTTVVNYVVLHDGGVTDDIFATEVRGNVMSNFELLMTKMKSIGESNRRKGAFSTIFEITEVYETRKVARYFRVR
jgi:hypothetical protein